ncbi:MAG: hypothetical protein ABIU09_10170 [Pyrinomonadaceae bacterium]
MGGQTDGRTGRKGSNKGIDGIKVFANDNSGKANASSSRSKMATSKSGAIRDLVGTLEARNGL